MDWLENEYTKCKTFCKKYKEYQRITNLTKYEPKLKTKQTQIKYELLNILKGTKKQ